MCKLISSGSPYEPKVGISRAVRAGSFIAVSGTVNRSRVAVELEADAVEE